MIRYNLPNGKTVFISWEQWDSLTDEDIQDMMADDMGFYTEDPFHPIYDLGGDPKVFTVPDVFSEDHSIPDEEVKKIKKDLNEPS
jgi:hypothetical protein